VFAVCSGSWGRESSVAQGLQAPLICSGLKADPRGDRLCWFGTGPALVGEGPIGWLRSWRQGQAFWQSRTAYTPEAASNLPS